MSLPAFVKWPSIQRLSSEVCFLTEKIDGTSGVVYVPESATEPLLAGSRERWLTNEDGTPPEKAKDNFGFGRWAHENAEALRRLGPGTHYGEWHGNGIQRGYGLPDKRFALFAYWRTDLAELNIPRVTKVPVLYEGEPTFDVFESAINNLRAYGSVLYPGFMKPEGIVITFKNMREAKFKKLCEKDKLHKYQQGKP